MSYILFYSNLCKHSQKFINMLEKSGEATFFVKICVDRDAKTKKRHPSIIQYNITEVPSIIVENKLLEGINAFNWLSEKIQSSYDKVNSIPTRQNKPQENIKQMNKEESSESFQPYTDIYSNYTDSCVVIGQDTQDTSIITQDVDSEVTRPSNFSLQDDNLTSTAIKTPVTNNKNTNIPSITVKKDSLKSKQINNEYNKLLAERENSVPQQQQRI